MLLLCFAEDENVILVGADAAQASEDAIDDGLEDAGRSVKTEREELILIKAPASVDSCQLLGLFIEWDLEKCVRKVHLGEERASL